MKNNAIIIVLLVFLAMTYFFWSQLPSEDPSSGKISTRSKGDGAKAEEFIKDVVTTLIDFGQRGTSQLELYGTDPFRREKPEWLLELEKESTEIDPATIFTISSIMYSELNALAVVNGVILAEGSKLHDEKPGSDFMIESIELDKVTVINGDKRYILEKSHEVD